MGGQTPGAANQPVRHGIFQTSLMSALLDGVYDGDMSVAQLLEHGDFGLGTFNALDGEMVVLDGVCYQLHDGGRARIADAKALTPFAVVTDFIPMHRVDLPADSSREQVAAIIGETISSENYLYAIRVTGEFAWVSTRTAARQQQPYPPLREATRNEPVIRFDDVAGHRRRFPDAALRAGHRGSRWPRALHRQTRGSRVVTCSTTCAAAGRWRSASARTCTCRCR